MNEIKIEWLKDIVLNTNMREYLSNFIALMPADCPGQFFPRQIVYEKASQATTTASNVPQGSHNLTLHITALSIRQPPVQPVNVSPTISSTSSSQSLAHQSASQQRPPHCSTCGHLQQGHWRLVSNGTSSKSCPIYPSNLCAREGHSTPCAGQWCSRQLQMNTNPSSPSLSQGPSVVWETHISPDVTEWLISFSQSTVTPGQMGSNACTVIAVYCAVNLIHNYF